MLRFFGVVGWCRNASKPSALNLATVATQQPPTNTTQNFAITATQAKAREDDGAFFPCFPTLSIYICLARKGRCDVRTDNMR